MIQFRFDARSDTGRVRTNNEDAGFAGPYLLCVADGVGGAAAGEVASATTTYVVSARALAHPGHEPGRLLSAAAREAHAQLAAGVAADPRRVGMATTLTAVLTDGVHTALAQVGDSRAYLLRAGELTQLSHDQTLVQEMVDAGRLTPAEAAASPYRNVVLHAIDGENLPEPELLMLALQPGDRLLLCSDGVSDVLSPRPCRCCSASTRAAGRPTGSCARPSTAAAATTSPLSSPTSSTRPPSPPTAWCWVPRSTCTTWSIPRRSGRCAPPESVRSPTLEG